MPSSPAPTAPLDPRTHAYRPDLADAALAGRVEARSFAPGIAGRIAVGSSSLRAAPDPASRQISEAIFGEPLCCFETRDGWSWVQMQGDRYVGYIEARHIANEAPDPDHYITAPRALIFAAADLKSPIAGWLPLTATVHVVEWRGDYACLHGLGWTHRRWLAPLDAPLADPMQTAARFLGAPYGWGGRTVAGIDCSGLVQVALRAAGLDCPRDSDQQAAVLGTVLDEDEAARRGDIIFFPGHVGLMVDQHNLLHANATQMAVSVDPLAEIVEIMQRSDAQGRAITMRRRLTA